jgi:NCS1 family nucleobase:cation symporter-1
VIQKKEIFHLKNWEIVSVNPANKDWDWKDLFCLWGNSIQSIIGFSLIASLYLAYDLNFLIVFFGCLIATVLVYLLANLIGKPSQKHGLPFPVILRTSMGINGARYVALLRAMVGIFMFGVQTFFISKSIGYLIKITLFSIDSSFLDQDIFLSFFMGMNIIDWIAFLFTLLIQYWLFSKGQSVNRSFINFSALFVYLGLIIFLIIIISENYNEVLNSFNLSFNIDNAIAKKNLVPLMTVIGTMFAYFSIILVNFGDFSRFVKNEEELNKGNISLIINLILFSFLTILIVLGVDIILTKNLVQIDDLLTNPIDIIGKFDNTYLTIISLIFILFASASTNLIANYIPSQNALLNFFPKNLSLKSSGFLIVLFGFFAGLFWLPVLSQIGILSIVDTISAFFGPIFGIMIADYYLIRNKNLSNKDIFSSVSESSYFFTNGWQIKGIYALFVGFIFSASTIWNTDLSFLQSFSWLIGAFASWITYYLLASN